jgi:hypothetical protein
MKKQNKKEGVYVTYVHTKEDTLNYLVSLSSSELASVQFVSVAYY